VFQFLCPDRSCSKLGRQPYWVACLLVCVSSKDIVEKEKYNKKQRYYEKEVFLAIDKRRLWSHIKTKEIKKGREISEAKKKGKEETT
jgi:hypothetical protein